MQQFKTQLVEVSSLKPHPRNYRKHGQAQLDQIVASIKNADGIYRNVVVANDWTILAGHGVVEACAREGISAVPVVRMDFGPDEPRAIRILTGDNEISRGADSDERALAQLLREVMEDVGGLPGTGFSDLELERLLAAERAINPGAEWEGMPAFEQGDKSAYRQIIVSFKSDKDVKAFAKLVRQPLTDKTRAIWYPKAKIDKVKDLRYAEK